MPLLVFDQDNLRRFKKEQYQLTRNEDIIGFFSEFDNYITEDEMWALRSLQIKSIDTVNLCFTWSNCQNPVSSQREPEATRRDKDHEVTPAPWKGRQLVNPSFHPPRDLKSQLEPTIYKSTPSAS